MDRVHQLQKAPRLRRPSVSDQSAFLPKADDVKIRRSTVQRSTSQSARASAVASRTSNLARNSNLITSTSGRVSEADRTESEDVLDPLRQSMKAMEQPKDYERILSIPFMINFDQIFMSSYPLQEATLSSIELIKQQIEEKFEKNQRRFSQSRPDEKASKKNLEEIKRFKKLRREKLLREVWNKQHRYRTTFRKLHTEMSEKWMEKAQTYLNELNPQAALAKIEKYLFYNPGYALAFIMKSLAFQILGDLRMASVAIKTAQTMGLSENDQQGVQERLAQIEFNQAEKFRELKEFKEAKKHYAAAHQIIPNFQDCPVRIINLEFEIGNVREATRLLDEQIICQPERLELRVRRTAQLLKMDQLDQCLEHLDQIQAIDPTNEEMLRMRRELQDRGQKHETACVMYLAANHIKDALLQVQLAIQARPRLVRLYLLRAKITRRLNLWESALGDLELICAAGVKELQQECNLLIFCILNDFGVFCIQKGAYTDAILLFNAALKHLKGERKIYLNRGDCWLRLGQSERALKDYNCALSLCLHEPTCRILRGRISVVHHEIGTRAYAEGNYKDAEHHFSLALEYQISPLYLIHRARSRIMVGLDHLAKLDALTAYKIDPDSPELLPVLARLFPDEDIPQVGLYQHRFFPEIENANSAKAKRPKAKNVRFSSEKESRKKHELISIGEMRSYLMKQNIQPLPPIRSNTDSQVQLTNATGWKQFNIGISNF